MQVELTYQMPYRRLAKLSRSARRKAFRTAWLLQWLLIAVVFAAFLGLFQYGDALYERMDKAGIPYAPVVAVVGIWLLFLAGFILLRRFSVNQAKSRVDYDRTIRLTTDDGGVRIAGETIEYYLKWPGISQMLIEPDGVVVSHGSLFFLVPDSAFANAGERLAFIRDVYGHLGESARAISERFVRPVLDADGRPPWRRQ
jgi:hypothetical protein